VLAVDRRFRWRGRGSGVCIVCGLQLGGVPWLRNTCEEPENNWKGITYASRLGCVEAHVSGCVPR